MRSDCGWPRRAITRVPGAPCVTVHAISSTPIYTYTRRVGPRPLLYFDWHPCALNKVWINCVYGNTPVTRSPDTERSTCTSFSASSAACRWVALDHDSSRYDGIYIRRSEVEIRHGNWVITALPHHHAWDGQSLHAPTWIVITENTKEVSTQSSTSHEWKFISAVELHHRRTLYTAGHTNQLIYITSI